MTTAHPDAWGQILTFLIAWWWLALIFGGSICAGIYEALETAMHRHHKRKLALAKERAKLARAVAEVEAHRAGLSLPYAPPAAIGAGPCKHRSNVVAVFDETSGERLAWLCKTCDTQLPPTYAVGPEDL